ncbi:MAG: UDP-N-acetylmuramate:L-alanyl-gamma-D-glutamyl-meso-diaminopimelate ligase [Sterolibacterium sp.]|nr:UDP-N-acetylmuramate:L-alanyl-gamma-D-glutamyl-meso-diaminopimelate ligase [Sterolibacterium sp.]
MHIHILGICGTFMGGVALLARAAGHQVTGCDAGVYPPMSTQLAAQGIVLTEGYAAQQLAQPADLYVIGNAISRGNPLLEAILARGLPYVSGPQWLAENILHGKWVLAVAGTHGKTTTSSMLAWILDHAGLKPGFLIGGVAQDFGISARLGETDFFVIEADEYDTAFCDKRSKFVHYRPRTLILNNLEFDHADIFADLAAIETQFHHLVRTLPNNGLIVANAAEDALRRVLARGCWTPVTWFNAHDGAQAAVGTTTEGAAETGWSVSPPAHDGRFAVHCDGLPLGTTQLALPGVHNQLNALAAIVAARHVGVAPEVSLQALAQFQGVKRRLEERGTVRDITVYDDFAHHPTAIALTIAGLRARLSPEARILAVLEPRSNTMKLGSMKAQLPDSLRDADAVFCYASELDWDVAAALAPLGAQGKPAQVFDQLDALVQAVAAQAHPGDRILVMSNGGFGGVHGRLLQALAA